MDGQTRCQAGQRLRSFTAEHTRPAMQDKSAGACQAQRSATAA